MIDDLWDEDTVRVEFHAGEGGQDTLDGRALRLLLDIWPATPHIWPDGPGWRVEAFVASQTEPVFDSGICATIAEAADKCREALS